MELLERELDVIVYGAGPSGLACGLAAAAPGRRVMWLCETPCLGGAATGGLRVQGDGACQTPLYRTMARLFTTAWDHTFYDPRQAEALMAAEAARAGLYLRSNARLLGVKTRDNQLRNVKLCTEEGLEKCTARVMIDASDDAALAIAAGASPLRPHNAWYALPARIGGLDTRLADLYDRQAMEALSESFGREILGGQTPLFPILPQATPLPWGGTAALTASAVRCDGTVSPQSLSVRQQCREQTEVALRFLRRALPGWQGAYVIDDATCLVRLNPCHMIGRAIQRDTAAGGSLGSCTVGWQACTLEKDALFSQPFANLLLAGGAASLSGAAAQAYESLGGQIALGYVAGELAGALLK